MILLIIKIISLLIAVLFTIVNTYKSMIKDSNGISVVDYIVQTIAITTFITLQWLI